MGVWDPTLTRLRDVLAYLFDNQDSARRIAIDTGLDPTKIKFSAKASDNLQAILEEAVKQDRVEHLVKAAQGQFGQNKQLLDAANDYRQSKPSKSIESNSVPWHYKDLDLSQKMRLVDALLLCQHVKNLASRNEILDDLPDDIKHNIQRHASDRMDVLAIINTAMNYRQGIDRFIAILRLLEGESAGMQAVDQVLAAIE